MFEVSILGAFLAGLLSFASPCILPLIPPYLSFIGGVTLEELGEAQASGDRRLTRRVFTSALAFVLGFTTVFIILGATASTIGQAVTGHFGILSIVAGVVIILLGAHFLGLFKLTPLYREARFHLKSRPAGLAGAYLVGLAFAFGWTPCVGPVLAAILFVAGAEQSAWRGAGLLLIYSLGIGIPFLAVSLFARPFAAFMGRFRRAVGYIEKILGLLLIATGILFLTGSMADIGFWLYEIYPVGG